MIYQLDTDHISLRQRRGPEAATLQAHLNRLGDDDYGTAIVAYEEQCRGRLAGVDRARTPAERVQAYAWLSASLRYFYGIAVWEYTSAAEAVFTRLKDAKLRVGTKDLQIAAVALANDATLLSRNLRDFTRIPGLRMEDWTAQPLLPKPSLAEKPSASALQCATVRAETTDICLKHGVRHA